MFVGRSYEASIIQSAIESHRSELGVVYGRRRVGKSSLLESLSKNGRDYYFEGLEGVSLTRQIDHFASQLSKQSKTVPARARSWEEAFEAFTPFIKTGVHYVVFDEFQWMASERHELVALLKFYWDRHWKRNPGLTLVLCGSVAQFMVKHIVHSRALHNRKTFEIKLEPLPAREARAFFKKFRSNFEISKFLMIFGGIPKYLEQIDPKISLSANMDRLCFQKDGFFISEFETVFKEQFKVTRTYEAIVQALSNGGRSKEQMSKILKMKPGGGLSDYLINLENADFVKKFHPIKIGSKSSTKTIRHVLWDDWLCFHFTYVKPNIQLTRNNKVRGLFDSVTSKSIESYFGLAFEKLCLKNMPTLLEHLKIQPSEVQEYGPYFRQPSRKKRGPSGLQIDILLKRRGNVMTLIECKFKSDPIGVNVITEVEKKIQLLKAPRGTTIEKVLIAANGVTAELERKDYFHKILGIDALF